MFVKLKGNNRVSQPISMFVRIYVQYIVKAIQLKNDQIIQNTYYIFRSGLI